MSELKTMIQISTDTRERLKDIRLVKRESYNEVIIRLLTLYNIGEKNENTNKFI